jgi:hypothetical protein
MKMKVFWAFASKFAMCHKSHSLEFCEVFQVHPVTVRAPDVVIFHTSKGAFKILSLYKC